MASVLEYLQGRGTGLHRHPAPGTAPAMTGAGVAGPRRARREDRRGDLRASGPAAARDPGDRARSTSSSLPRPLGDPEARLGHRGRARSGSSRTTSSARCRPFRCSCSRPTYVDPTRDRAHGDRRFAPGVVTSRSRWPRATCSTTTRSSSSRSPPRARGRESPPRCSAHCRLRGMPPLPAPRPANLVAPRGLRSRCARGTRRRRCRCAAASAVPYAWPRGSAARRSRSRRRTRVPDRPSRRRRSPPYHCTIAGATLVGLARAAVADDGPRLAPEHVVLDPPGHVVLSAPAG